MNRTMRLAHPIAGTIALLTILVFWSSSLAVEIAGAAPAIVAVKTLIPWGLLILVPALAVTGASGFRLGRGRSDRRVSNKRRRMPFIAANGVLVLIRALCIWRGRRRPARSIRRFMSCKWWS